MSLFVFFGCDDRTGGETDIIYIDAKIPLLISYFIF